MVENKQVLGESGETEELKTFQELKTVLILKSSGLPP